MTQLKMVLHTKLLSKEPIITFQLNIHVWSTV